MKSLRLAQGLLGVAIIYALILVVLGPFALGQLLGPNVSIPVFLIISNFGYLVSFPASILILVHIARLPAPNPLSKNLVYLVAVWIGAIILGLIRRTFVWYSIIVLGRPVSRSLVFDLPMYVIVTVLFYLIMRLPVKGENVRLKYILLTVMIFPILADIVFNFFQFSTETLLQWTEIANILISILWGFLAEFLIDFDLTTGEKQDQLYSKPDYTDTDQ